MTRTAPRWSPSRRAISRRIGIVERQHALRDRRALGPDDRRDVRRAASSARAGAHRQLGERAGRQEVLEGHVVVRALVTDRADDPVWRIGSG